MPSNTLPHVAGGLLKGVGQGMILSGKQKREDAWKMLDLESTERRHQETQRGLTTRHQQTMDQRSQQHTEMVDLRHGLAKTASDERRGLAKTAADRTTSLAQTASDERTANLKTKLNAAQANADRQYKKMVELAKERNANTQEMARIKEKADQERFRLTKQYQLDLAKEATTRAKEASLERRDFLRQRLEQAKTLAKDRLSADVQRAKNAQASREEIARIQRSHAEKMRQLDQTHRETMADQDKTHRENLAALQSAERRAENELKERSAGRRQEQSNELRIRLAEIAEKQRKGMSDKEVFDAVKDLYTTEDIRGKHVDLEGIAKGLESIGMHDMAKAARDGAQTGPKDSKLWTDAKERAKAWADEQRTWGSTDATDFEKYGGETKAILDKTMEFYNQLKGGGGDPNPRRGLTGTSPRATQPSIRDQLATFNAEGNGYDQARADAIGMERDEGGHMGSVAPATAEDRQKYGVPEGSYLILKGKRHPTFDKAVAGEESLGRTVKKFGDRYFAVPKEAAAPAPAKPAPPAPSERPPGDGTRQNPFVGSTQAHIDWFKANAPKGAILEGGGKRYQK